MPMTVRQIPKDGYGKEQTIIGSGIRLKAKNLQTARSTTLKITGMDSGAVQYVNILVQTGIPARFANPIESPEIPPDKREERKEERQEEEKRKEERQEEEKRKEQRQEDERREERDKKDGRR
tara:strand:- start:503 stop:868 length:366 start_codon:yes stop_codon:yes gene_type:complete